MRVQTHSYYSLRIVVEDGRSFTAYFFFDHSEELKRGNINKWLKQKNLAFHISEPKRTCQSANVNAERRMRSYILPVIDEKALPESSGIEAKNIQFRKHND